MNNLYIRGHCNKLYKSSWLKASNMDKETSPRYFKVVDIKCISGLFYFVILQALVAIILGENTVTLEPKDGRVVIGENLTLTCSASGSQWFNISTWLVSSQTLDGIISYNYASNTCTVDGILANKSQFKSSCDGHHKYRTMIINVGTGRHGEVWGCFILDMNGIERRSNDIIINVDVPVTKVSIHDSTWSTIEVQENTNLTLQCVTSPCRPSANITWHFVDENGRNNIVDFAERTTTAIENNLTTTQSSIWFNASKDMNGWSVRCNASNIHNYTEPTDSVQLNVTYLTNMPTIQCSENGTYKVIRHRLRNLTCSVDGGNPAGTLSWSCDGNSNQLSLSNIYKTMVLNATQNGTCTCTSTNVAGKRNTSVKIDVMFPPVLKEIQNISVIEGDPLFFKCDIASSHPPVSTIGWTSSKYNTSNATLIIQNVLRTDAVRYTCTAKNSMEPSCGVVVIGSTSIYMHLDVMYPPLVTIQPSKHFTRNESDLFNYTCPIIEGNPSNTTFQWKRSSDNATWNSKTFTLPHVSRHDDSVYTCNATNIMTDSNGTTRYGNSSGNITLHVQFGASVTNFFILGHKQNTSVSVIENSNLTFECHVESKPVANISILKKNIAVISSYENVLVYNTTALCSGEQDSYKCKDSNLLSTKPSTLGVQLTVKCKPRADANANIKHTVASAINQTVTMSYTAIAYPHPSFIWFRNGSSIESSDPSISVSSSSLQTNLTIEHVEESDFGEYYLNASNDVGFINKVFHLKPEGVPEVPTHLTQDNNSTTESTITLYWMSGFNNGLEQTFTILYRKQSEVTWQSVRIPDSGQTGTTISYAITGLSPDTSYAIVLFSENDIGRSRRNATLVCRTDPAVIDEFKTTQSVSAIVGGTCAGMVILYIIAVLMFLYRRRRSMKDKRSESSTDQPIMYENLKIEQIPQAPLDYQRETSNNEIPEANVDTCNTYEGLSQQRNEKESEYTQLGNPSNDSNDDAKQTYENLKIQLSSCQPSYNVTSAI